MLKRNQVGVTMCDGETLPCFKIVFSSKGWWDFYYLMFRISLVTFILVSGCDGPVWLVIVSVTDKLFCRLRWIVCDLLISAYVSLLIYKTCC